MQQHNSKSTLKDVAANFFCDHVEESPFLDASNSFGSDQYASNYESSSIANLHNTSIQSEDTPESCPSSLSYSAGLRHRRPVLQQTSKDLSRFLPFKHNSDSDPDGSTMPPGNSQLSWNWKDDETMKTKMNSTKVRVSSSKETSSNSAVTSSNGDERINPEFNTVDSQNTDSIFLFTLAGLLIKVIGLQISLFVSFITLPIWLTYYSYIFVINPFRFMRRARRCIVGRISRSWGLCYGGVKSILYQWIKKHESIWKLCFRMGWGFLWSAYVCIVLVCLFILAFVFSGILMKCLIQAPVKITEPLNFDYTRDSPTAVLPIMSCPEHSILECSEKITHGYGESRVIPLGHKLQTTVSLTLPESNYNRNLGVFQVRVDFLSCKGKPLASTRQPCMLQFKSQPIRLLLTLLKLAPLITGYSSESQTLDIEFSGYTEGDVPTSSLRMVMEQRAEFTRGGGVPEIYAASVKVESQPPFLKRMLWSWKVTVYVWISIMMFTVELLFMLLFCTPVLVPWLRPRPRGVVSSNRNASRTTRAGPK